MVVIFCLLIKENYKVLKFHVNNSTLFEREGRLLEEIRYYISESTSMFSCTRNIW